MNIGLPSTIGPYRPIDLVADDGLTCSYRVQTPATSAPPRILKTLLPKSHVDTETLERFKREVVIQMSVHHPNVWEVVDFGFWGRDVPYIVMDDLGDRTLADTLRDQGVLELPRWRDVMQQILCGVEAIHQAGAVHRGLATDRVLEASDNTIKIFDFAFSSRQGMARLTPFGVSIGSPEYISPEQMFDAHEADGRSDLFSVGVIGFELLTGHLPIETPIFAERVSRLANGEYESVGTWRADVPVPVVRWLARLMEVPRERRFETAALARHGLRQQD